MGLWSYDVIISLPLLILSTHKTSSPRSISASWQHEKLELAKKFPHFSSRNVLVHFLRHPLRLNWEMWFFECEKSCLEKISATHVIFSGKKVALSHEHNLQSFDHSRTYVVFPKGDDSFGVLIRHMHRNRSLPEKCVRKYDPRILWWP